MGMLVSRLMGLMEFTEVLVLGRKMWKVDCFECCDEKVLCVVNTWFKKKENVKMTYISGLRRETEIVFALVGRRNRKHVKGVRKILGEYLRNLLVIELDDRSSRKKVKP